MDMLDRLMFLNVWKELSAEKSMVFLAGPRQSGKTTLSMLIAGGFVNSLYFNWDIPEDRSRFIASPTFFETLERKDLSTPLIILDEIHKYKDWKNYLKGIYDKYHSNFKFLITGSGRLDIYQKGGDSLAGRYYIFHLSPLTISELCNRNLQMDDFLSNPLYIGMERSAELKEIWEALSNLSGFPEPYAAGREMRYRRWSNTYSHQLIREDVRDMTEIKSVREIETLYYLLPSKVGSPISVTSLAGDIGVAYNSVRNWLDIFERFYIVFSIPTWTEKVSRSIQKERKYYLWDYPRIKDLSARFENMVAAELWRAVTLWNDMGYGSFSLHFIRNKEKQEVDFLIANNREPFLLIEAKMSDAQPSKSLVTFQRALNVPAVQLTNAGDTFRLIPNGKNNILIAPAYQWLSQLP